MSTISPQASDPSAVNGRHVLLAADPAFIGSIAADLRSLDYTVHIAETDEVALRKIERFPIEVAVVGIVPGRIEGVETLSRLKIRAPGVTRVALAQRLDGPVRQRLTTIAHQAVAMPIDGEALAPRLERAIALQGMLTDPAVRAAVGGLGQLPTPSALYQKLTRMLDRPDVPPRTVATLIESYPSFAAKVLQVVNSAFFGPGLRCSSITHAVNYLGTDMLRSLVLSAEVYGSFAARLRTDGPLTQTRFRLRGMLAARLASEMLEDEREAEVAFTAGLLHDVGLLIMATALPERAAAALDGVRAESRPLHEVEMQRYGVTHAQVGAYLLGVWGLGGEVVEAVAHHHEPTKLGEAPFGPAMAVHVAAALVEEAMPWAPLGDGRGLPALCATSLRQSGRHESLPAWRARVPETLEELTKALAA